MGGQIPKQYLVLGGLPLLVHSLRLFESIASIDEVVLVVPEEDRGFCREVLVPDHGIKKVAHIVAGGARRQDSVLNGLKAIGGHMPRWILVHDAARPFVTVDLVERVLEAGRRTGAAVAALPMPDTVKRVDKVSGIICGTLNRDELWLIQTPQVFRYDWLVQGHELARRENLDVTDDAALIESLGYPVMVVEGSSMNLKITRPEDLLLGEAVLRARSSN